MTSNSDDDMAQDYSEAFERARANGTLVRGQFFESAMRARGYVRVDHELLAAFPSSTELNAALRGLMEASRHVHLPQAV